MKARASFVRLCLSAAALAAALGAARADAPRRADLFTPSAGVALTGLAKQPTAPSLDPLAAPEAPPVVEMTAQGLRLSPSAPAEIDFAFALMPDAQRELALALDDWRRSPDVARDATRRAMRDKIADAYAARQFAPFWIDGGKGWRESASSASSRLRAAGDDGLDLREVKLPATDREADVAGELALSEAVATYAYQARGGRLQPDRISHLIGAKTYLPDPAEVVASVANAGERANETLQDYNPPHFGYQQLREKLAELRGRRAGLPELDHLAAVEDGVSQTDALPPAKLKRRRLETLGGASTPHVEAEVIANMERWRWLPRDMGDDRIEVNIPDFELSLIRHGQVAHQTRVIVGKETTPTPIFSDEMVEIIVNPSWYVPQSIITKEWHGGVGAGYQVSYRNGQMVVRQPPGEKNALGRIKFLFPNDYAVYMHDTPSRGLFSQSHRAFSHGCMRVDQPFALAEAVLGPGSGWSEERVKRLVGDKERYINLSKPLPVHVVYFTAYVDETGRLVQRPDLYGYSARVRKALGLGG